MFAVISLLLGWLAIITGGAAAFLVFLFVDLVLVLLGLFGEIILVPLAILSPVSFILAILSY